jgi:hypothetical protein
LKAGRLRWNCGVDFDFEFDFKIKSKKSNKKNNNMKGTRPNAYDYGGHPAPYGASPTQPYKCSQNVKVKIKTALILAIAEIKKLTLTLNILTALKGWVGHAPQGRGALLIIISFNLLYSLYATKKTSWTTFSDRTGHCEEDRRSCARKCG